VVRILHIDPFSGASGDMLLGALVDAGADIEQVRGSLTRLGIDGWELRVSEVVRGGLRACSVDVVVADEHPQPRPWRDIRRLLVEAPLDEAIAERALATFTRLAEAEAVVHAVPAEEVHFHEVGGLDAIVDIVGVCAAVQLLGVQRVTASRVPLGHGAVRTTHGLLPVPAPAVLEILRGLPVVGGEQGVELCTPTGAALLAALVEDWHALPAMAVSAIGYGAGSRELRHPNILRVALGEGVLGDGAEDAGGGGGAVAEPLVMLEATIDDMSGELTPAVLDAVRAAGARDAWVRQVLMKKGRPGVELVALVAPGDVPVVRRELFRQSTTLGVREHVVHRQALDRLTASVDVAGHPVRVKLGRLDAEVVNVAPEFDDCAAVAARTGLAVKTVMELARAAWHGVAPAVEGDHA
jgi:pyridinium-3,5-bisthiocarboxylic acid mononucleotide nickel chelatase